MCYQKSSVACRSPRVGPRDARHLWDKRATGLENVRVATNNASLCERVRFTDTLRMRLRELETIRVAYGYGRLHVRLRREGWQIKHKRVYQLYRLEGLSIRKKVPRRRVACVKREVRAAASTRNECWSVDFVSNQLFNVRRLQVSVIIENYTRECLALGVNARIREMEVVTTLEHITQEHGFPKRIKVDNGPEFISKDVDRWSYWNQNESAVVDTLWRYSDKGKKKSGNRSVKFSSDSIQDDERTMTISRVSVSWRWRIERSVVPRS